MPARVTLGLVVALAAAAWARAADETVRVFAEALPPTREALDRLNLKMAWRGFVPMDGRRDGFANIQLHEQNMFVQTRSGLVAMLEAETGRTLWRARVGLPFQPKLPLAVNSRGVYVVNGTYLYGLNRDSGAVEWQFSLPAGLSAAPVADEEQLYLSTVSNRLYAYRLQKDFPSIPAEKPTTLSDIDPNKRPILPADKNQRSTPSITYFTSVRQAGSELSTGAVPILNWSNFASARLEWPPVYSKTVLFVASPDDTYFAMDKNLDGQKVGAYEVYRERTDGPIPVAPGAYDDTAYVGSADANLYAIHIEKGQVLWRFTPGTAIVREPAVMAQDIYVVSRRGGLARVDRASGDAMWHLRRGNHVLTGNPEATRFLAVNAKFVYAADASDRLLVLDRQRGTQLSQLDVRDFGFPVSNTLTDRLYLAAHNGLLVCLHDKDYPEAYRHRPLEERTQSPAAVLRDILNKPVTEKASDQQRSVRDVLRDLGKRYNFQIDIGEKAFKAEKREPVSDLLVNTPPAENMPLKDYIQKILEPVNARFEAVGDTIMVLPAKPKAP